MRRFSVAIVFVLSLLVAPALGRTIVVDINGSGEFTSIQAALNAAVNNDVIKVLPGAYNEAITISKNVVLQGSGYETTTIASNHDPTVSMSSGKIMWFSITSNVGDGISATAGQITNCIARGCARCGAYINGDVLISNSVFYNNGSEGVWGWNNGRHGNVNNCIGRSNKGHDFHDIHTITSCCAESFGNLDYWSDTIIGDPKFASETDYHISSTSPCWNTGKADIYDPDGSRSDMGYYGGPDCPIFPVVTDIQIVPQPDGSFIITATGVANY